MPPPLVDSHTHLLLTGPPHYPRAMRDVDALLEQQRAHGILHSVVYSPMEIQRAFRSGGDPDGYAVRYNDFIAGIQQQYPGEITGAGIVYPFSGEAAAREAERAVRQLGLRGLMANPYIRGAWIDQDARAEPFLAAVESLGVPLILHPEEDLEREIATAVGRELRYAEGLVLWRTLATALVLYGIACGPLLETFPKLKLVFAHGGGAFWPSAVRVDLLFKELLPAADPIVLGQWQGDAAVADPLARLSDRAVYFDCAWFDADAMLAAVRRFGADRFMFGTDGSAHGASIAFFGGRFEQAGLSPDELRLIGHDNALRLFGVKG